jgi:hypothetical protein
MPYMPPEGPFSAEAEWGFILRTQQNVVSTAQALALGMTPDAIRSKVESGRWQRVYRGAYATFTGDLSREARLWAVVLRCGPGALLSYETAAEIHGFAYLPADRIHVTVPEANNPARWTDLRNVVVHRSLNCQFDPQPPWNLPRTPVNATVLDLVDSAATLDDAYAWLSRAITGKKATIGMLGGALKERKKIRRRTWLEDALLDVSDGIHFPLERRWTRDVQRAHGLPAATHQVRREGADGIRFLDNLYQPYNLSVELDGLAFHPPEERDKDKHRDNETVIATGAQTLRYGFRQVANHPCDQAAQFARALVKNGWPAATLKRCEKPRCPVIAVAERLQVGDNS